VERSLVSIKQSIDLSFVNAKIAIRRAFTLVWVYSAELGIVGVQYDFQILTDQQKSVLCFFT
jgi:hypothetical protein